MNHVRHCDRWNEHGRGDVRNVPDWKFHLFDLVISAPTREFEPEIGLNLSNASNGSLAVSLCSREALERMGGIRYEND